MRSLKLKITLLDVVIIALLIIASAVVFYRIKVGLNYKWNWAVVPQYLFRYDELKGKWVANFLIQGFATTIRLSIWGTVLATIIGVIMGLCRTSTNLFLRLVSRVYVEAIRNTPPLVLIFIFYFFIGDQIFSAMGIDEFIRSRSESTQRILTTLIAPPEFFVAFLSALLTISLLEGAYIAEIVRSGIQSIEKGQWLASKALGFTKWQQMRHVILPQAIQRILPPLAGQFISLVKDSSIVSVISIQELTFQATELMAATSMTIEIWLVVAALYMTLTLSCSLLIRRLEVRMALRM